MSQEEDIPSTSYAGLSTKQDSPVKNSKTEGDSVNTTSSEDESPVAKRAKVEEENKDDAKSKLSRQEEERLKMQVLVSNFSEDQLNRYEVFRRAAFPKAAVKRLMQSYVGSALSPNVVIAMSGIAKVFVGEIVETALDVKEQWKETGPIQPKHLREAVRRLKNKGQMPWLKHRHGDLRL